MNNVRIVIDWIKGFLDNEWGKKRFKNTIKQDGNINRIRVDFIIDETGKVREAC